MISRLVVIGVGLIGGSAALALRRAHRVGEVIGVGRSPDNLKLARDRGIIDRATSDYADACAGADVVLVATPVAQFERIFAAITPHLGRETIVTDAGSTKQDVVAAARRAFGHRFGRFVPAHPIAGTEHSGAAAAFPELFERRNVVVTPEAETDAVALIKVRMLWEATGAQVMTMTAERHDAIFAAVSHLPHLLAFALVEELARRPDSGDYFELAASGFRDFTRIASSSPEMWRDIALANRDALLEEIHRFRAQIERVERLVAAGDGAQLGALFATAQAARNTWTSGRGSATVAHDGD